jgi:hypothetical protein
MLESITQAHEWASEEFSHTDLEHGNRTKRLIQMATEVALRPSGKVSEVFTTSAEAEGAYRWIENPSVTTEALVEGIGRACAVRSAAHAFVYVPVDGSSVSVVDLARAKGFGALGTTQKGGRGVKVMGAIAVDPSGGSLGVAALEYWSRRHGARKSKSRIAGTPVAEKETQRWLDAITHTSDRLAEYAPKTRCWYQIDREANSWAVLHHLAKTEHWFTVRGSNRRLASSKPGQPVKLHDVLAREKPLVVLKLHVAPGPKRQERDATLVVRAQTVTLELRDPWSNKCRPLTLQGVWVHEEGTTPSGEKPLDWILLTNHDVKTADDATRVVFGYSLRWRIEQFHKTWKSGACKVEETQLHSVTHVTKWATLLAAVAIRIERLKFLSRSTPAEPASAELTKHEIRALVMWKRKTKKRTEPAPSDTPSIGDAVTWIAQMGGYTGKSSGGPPGSITIRRGLERLRQRAAVFEELEFLGEK